jgi:hypothetical protein
VRVLEPARGFVEHRVQSVTAGTRFSQIFYTLPRQRHLRRAVDTSP